MSSISKVKVDLEVSGLDEALEKVQRLKDLLLEVAGLIESLK